MGLIIVTAKIHISEGEIIDVNRKNLISCSCSIADRGDFKLPSFGVISNTGEIEFSDTDGEVFRYAEALKLIKGAVVELYLENTLYKDEKSLIGSLETDEWDYDIDGKVVKVSLKDDLEEWQDIEVAEISYDPRKAENKPFKWLYEHLHAITSINYKMLSFDELDKNTKHILSTSYTRYPLLYAGSLWAQWTKLCQVCQLHIYKESNGIIVCKYNGGD